MKVWIARVGFNYDGACEEVVCATKNIAERELKRLKLKEEYANITFHWFDIEEKEVVEE